MKCHLDYCRLQWVIRELCPLKYVFRNEFNKSRFCAVFATFFGQEEEKEEVLYLPHANGPSFIEKANIQDKGGSAVTYPIGATAPIQKTLSKIVDISKILSQEDKRTTLMIKNIPNKFTKSFFLELFMKDFQGKYDLFLLPIDFKEKKNFGYGFINFIDCLHIIHFYDMFNGKKWPNTNSLKICEIVYSKMQGMRKLLKHYPLKTLQSSNNNEKEKQECDAYDHHPSQIHITLSQSLLKEFTTMHAKAPLHNKYLLVSSEQIPLFEKK